MAMIAAPSAKIMKGMNTMNSVRVPMRTFSTIAISRDNMKNRSHARRVVGMINIMILIASSFLQM